MLNAAETKDYTHSFPYYLYHIIIDDNVYHYQVCIHCYIAMLSVIFPYLALTTTFTSGVKHVYGLYAITR